LGTTRAHGQCRRWQTSMRFGDSDLFGAVLWRRGKGARGNGQSRRSKERPFLRGFLNSSRMRGPAIWTRFRPAFSACSIRSSYGGGLFQRRFHGAGFSGGHVRRDFWPIDGQGSAGRFRSEPAPAGQVARCTWSPPGASEQNGLRGAWRRSPPTRSQSPGGSSKRKSPAVTEAIGDTESEKGRFP